MGCSFRVVEDKLKEADFFLRRFCTTDVFDPEGLYYFSAFVSASRSVTFALQHSLGEIGGFDSWYNSARHRLRTDRLAPFFVEVRNSLVHRGINPLNQISGDHLREHLSKQIRGRERFHVLVIPGTSGGGSQSADAVDASTDYFRSLVEVVFDCYKQFLTEIDAKWYFTKENFRVLGKTLDDALAELGFSPCWIEAMPTGGDEEAWRVLRDQCPGCQVNDLFWRYLGEQIHDPDISQ